MVEEGEQLNVKVKRPGRTKAITVHDWDSSNYLCLFTAKDGMTVCTLSAWVGEEAKLNLYSSLNRVRVFDPEGKELS